MSWNAICVVWSSFQRIRDKCNFDDWFSTLSVFPMIRAEERRRRRSLLPLFFFWKSEVKLYLRRVACCCCFFFSSSKSMNGAITAAAAVNIIEGPSYRRSGTFLTFPLNSHQSRWKKRRIFLLSGKRKFNGERGGGRSTLLFLLC